MTLNLIDGGRPRGLGDLLAEQVRVMMVRRRTTQVQLARLVHVSQPSISSRLNGRIEWQLHEIEALCRYWGITLGELLGPEMLDAPAAGELPGPDEYTSRDSNPEPAD